MVYPADVHGLDWDHAVYRQDTRKTMRRRIQAYAYGLDDNKLYAAVLTMRGDAVRIISQAGQQREERRFQTEEIKTMRSKTGKEIKGIKGYNSEKDYPRW